MSFTSWPLPPSAGWWPAQSLAAAAEDKDKPKDPKKPLLLQEPHICRGLNPTCKGEYKGKKNDCAGQAFGPSIKEHVCKTHNDCAGLGGCGEHPGENKCKEMGECAVPLKDKAWEKAQELRGGHEES